MTPPPRKYTFKAVLVIGIFCFVLFNLVFKLIIDIRAESVRKKEAKAEKARLVKAFNDSIETQYTRLMTLYQAGEYEKVVELIKVFNQYHQADYKELPRIKKQIRIYYLKKKLEFLPKIPFKEYVRFSRDIDIQEDDSTEIFIRRPRYGQYFYTTDLPVELEAVALSIKGDFSDTITWESDRDGSLGKGRMIRTMLSVGEHTITATGSNGITRGQMVTTVFVEKAPAFLKNYKR